MNRIAQISRAGLLLVAACGALIATGAAPPVRAQFSSSVMVVARYADDGSPDVSFGTDGQVRIPVAPFGFHATGLALDAADRPVVAGNTPGSDGGDIILVTRLNLEGMLDASFGPFGGRAFIDLPTEREVVRAIAVDEQGRIVIAGDACCVAGRTVILVIRLLPDGQLDPAFGIGGVVLATYASFSDLNEAHAVALDPFGRIVVAGRALNGGNRMVGIARFGERGRLDPTFDGDGRLTNDQFSVDPANAVALDALGRIAIAGPSFTPTPFMTHKVFAVVRFRSNGALDTSFGQGGGAMTDFPSTSNDDEPFALAARGVRLVAAGTAIDFTFEGFDFDGFSALARYTGSGAPDTTFGTGGQLLTDWFTDGIAGVRALKIDAAGRLVAGGRAAGDAPLSTEYFAIARYLPDGTPDEAFDVDGGVVTSFGATSQRLAGVAIDSTGRIVAAGDADFLDRQGP